MEDGRDVVSVSWSFMATKRLPVVPEDAEESSYGNPPFSCLSYIQLSISPRLAVVAKRTMALFSVLCQFRLTAPTGLCDEHEQASCLCRVSCKTFVDPGGPGLIFRGLEKGTSMYESFVWKRKSAEDLSCSTLIPAVYH